MSDHDIYVREMFSRIAPRYDLLNRLMSLGRDMAWRRYMISQAGLPPGGRLLDVAVGTGDVAFEAVRRFPDALVVGADFAVPMMRVGMRRLMGDRVAWCCADAYHLPFPDETFDAVTSAFLLRNLADVSGFLVEALRVVKRGGRVLSLDAYPPPPGPLRPLVRFYLRGVIPLLGLIFAGQPDAYTYLPRSIEAFRSPEDLSEIMLRAGLTDVRYRRFMLGSVAVHVGIRP